MEAAANHQVFQTSTMSVIILQNTTPLTSVPGCAIMNAVAAPTVMAAATKVAPIASKPKPIKPGPLPLSKGGAIRYSPALKPPKKYREDDEDSEILRCKRRLDFAKLGLPFHKANPNTVMRRNERERKRVKQINGTFTNLRDHLPGNYCKHKNPNKMSKVDTLRGAIDYINNLQQLVDDYDTVNAAFNTGMLTDALANSQVDESPESSPMQSQPTYMTSLPPQYGMSNACLTSPGSTCSTGSSVSTADDASPVDSSRQPLSSPEEGDGLIDFSCWF